MAALNVPTPHAVAVAEFVTQYEPAGQASVVTTTRTPSLFVEASLLRHKPIFPPQ